MSPIPACVSCSPVTAVMLSGTSWADDSRRVAVTDHFCKAGVRDACAGICGDAVLAVSELDTDALSAITATPYIDANTALAIVVIWRRRRPRPGALTRQIRGAAMPIDLLYKLLPDLRGVVDIGIRDTYRIGDRPERHHWLLATQSPGLFPAVYPGRLAARLDCLSRTRHPLLQRVGTLDAHFQFCRWGFCKGVPSSGGA